MIEVITALLLAVAAAESAAVEESGACVPRLHHRGIEYVGHDRDLGLRRGARRGRAVIPACGDVPARTVPVAAPVGIHPRVALFRTDTGRRDPVRLYIARGPCLRFVDDDAPTRLRACLRSQSRTQRGRG